MVSAITKGLQLLWQLRGGILNPDFVGQVELPEDAESKLEPEYRELGKYSEQEGKHTGERELWGEA